MGAEEEDAKEKKDEESGQSDLRLDLACLCSSSTSVDDQ